MGIYSVGAIFSPNAKKKIALEKSSETRILFAPWPGFVVDRLKFVFVSTLKDQFVFLV